LGPTAEPRRELGTQPADPAAPGNEGDEELRAEAAAAGEAGRRDAIQRT
jgi:hypothetical protein